ncbi:predicted protein [Postia placenta Mad-698-R]|nr:predicted protein [Postia placenta Mad-698-R]
MPGLIVLDAATCEEEQTEREEGSIRCACAFAELRWRQGTGKLLGEFESALHGYVIATDAINVSHSGCTVLYPLEGVALCRIIHDRWLSGSMGKSERERAIVRVQGRRVEGQLGCVVWKGPGEGVIECLSAEWDESR